MVEYITVIYAIPAESTTWVERIEKACSLLETAFEDERLTWAHSRKDATPDKQIKNRRSYLNAKCKTGSRLFSLYNGKPLLSRGGIAVDNGHLGIGGRFNAGPDQAYSVSLTCRVARWREFERVFSEIGDALDAHWSQLTPYATYEMLARYEDAADSTSGSTVTASPDVRNCRDQLTELLKHAGLSLPRLQRVAYLRLHGQSANPEALGWINYWSVETCEYLGFPDAKKDADLLARSYQTPRNAWIVKLSNDPLDLTRSDHLKTYANAYARFSKLGTRRTE